MEVSGGKMFRKGFWVREDFAFLELSLSWS